MRDELVSQQGFVQIIKVAVLAVVRLTRWVAFSTSAEASNQKPKGPCTSAHHFGEILLLPIILSRDVF
jgi:hypothetical protein